MSRPSPQARVMRILVTVLILGVLFVYRHFQGDDNKEVKGDNQSAVGQTAKSSSKNSSPSREIVATGLEAHTPLLNQISLESGSAASVNPLNAQASYERKANGWVKLHGCTLVENRYNDGDSFLVSYIDEQGKKVETNFRLYFVDTPESRDKPYDDHRRRVEEQGQELGGLSYDEALLRGQQAKAQVSALLKAKPFTVWTKWESVYQSERRYALVQVHGDAGPQWLHRALVKTGLARVHTKGIDLPAGTTRREEEDRLEKMQQEAIDAQK